MPKPSQSTLTSPSTKAQKEGNLRITCRSGHWDSSPSPATFLVVTLGKFLNLSEPLCLAVKWGS